MSDLPEHLPSVERFNFVKHHYDPATGIATLVYAFDDGVELEETLEFPYQPWPSDPSRQAAFMQALKILHLLAGVSYWKACIPQSMGTGDMLVDQQMADFLRHVYTDGLAEFAWHHDLDLHKRVHFESVSGTAAEPVRLDLPERALVAMGGGKDSLVSLETLRAAGVEIQPFCVGQSALIGDTVKAAGLPLIRIKRQLSPQLALMNEAGALNGHVPVTAINSAIALCAAIAYGYRHVVFSNEHSANEATLHDKQGRAVNHQWSKSEQFELMFRNLIVKQVSADIEYFSLLRPFNEVTIAASFARLDQYHDVFSSCNRNFHIDGSRNHGRWCGDCPKCRFTSLALAPFLQPRQVQDILGSDLLNDEAQIEGFRSLCQLDQDKPFECVGTVEECRVAICHLATLPQWREHAIVAGLSGEITCDGQAPLDELLKRRYEHCVPPQVSGGELV